MLPYFPFILHKNEHTMYIKKKKKKEEKETGLSLERWLAPEFG